MNIFKKISAKTKKILSVFSAAALSCSALAVGAFAAGETSGSSALAGASDQIIEQFNNAASDITPIIIGVLGSGLGIFVIFLGIRFGKKMFKTVSNG